MTSDKLLVPECFPRASKYHPEWIKSSVSGGANSMWMHSTRRSLCCGPRSRDFLGNLTVTELGLPQKIPPDASVYESTLTVYPYRRAALLAIWFLHMQRSGVWRGSITWQRRA